MKIVCLIENTGAERGLKEECGLSFYIETQHHKVLFDMGVQSGFLENAHILGVDFSQVDVAVLSHGHYDHGGGLRTFLEKNDKATVYVQQGAFGNFYSQREQEYFYIGLDQELINHPRLCRLEGDLVIDDELHLFTGVCGNEAWVPSSNSNLLVKEGGTYERDSFAHEQNLLISSGGSHVLFSGCSHCGILNILEACEKRAQVVPDRVMGGFHLMSPRTGKGVAPSVLKDLSLVLNERGCVYHTCHCTGKDAFNQLHSLMGDKIHYISTGDELCI